MQRVDSGLGKNRVKRSRWCILVAVPAGKARGQFKIGVNVMPSPVIVKSPMRILDLQTGEVVEEGTANWMMLPPPASNCQECATEHAPDEPHNAQSLYYSMAFHAMHGRSPTWADAVAHCTPEVQAAWREELKKMDAWTEPEQPEVDG